MSDASRAASRATASEGSTASASEGSGTSASEGSSYSASDGSSSSASGARDIRVVSTGATDEDVAAVMAVLTGALEELADAMATEPAPVVSAWQRSQRSVRAPLHRGAGAWRSFSG